MGPHHVKSFCSAHYFFSVVDDASRVVWVYLMKEKSEASQLVKIFYSVVHTQFETKVKNVRSDNGSEFAYGLMKKFYGEQRIIHQTNCVDAPQQNRRVKRKIIIF